MKFIKSKIFWVIIAVLVIIIGYFIFKPKPQPVYTTEKVTKGKLEQTVSVTGSVQGANDINLNFDTLGTLAKIEVSKGDVVKSGQILGQLSAQTQQSSVSEAQANLQATSAQLDKLVAGASQNDIKVSAEGVKNSEIAYNNRQTDLVNLKLKLAADKSQSESSVSK